MKKAITNFIRNSIDCLAPYTVYNYTFGKAHYSWTRRAALEWLACYAAEDFGTTVILDFNGSLIAAKF